MTIKEFNQLVQQKVLILDGATGSNLLKRGMPAGVCPEQWIIENPEVLKKLQQEFVEAGSDIVYAPTFAANKIKLAEYDLASEIEHINKTLVAISKEAVGGKAYVAGDLTMTGEQLAPMGTLDFEELVDIYKEQITYLVEAGVDLLVVETMLSLQECRAALIAAKETCDLPVMVTLTFNEDGKTLFGTEPSAAAVVLTSLGAAAIGINCSAGPDKMIPIIEEMAQYTNLPLIAKPNAGLPELQPDGTTEYSMAPDEFVHYTKELIQAGAEIVGGCCGTTPEFIEKIYEFTKDYQKPDRRKLNLRVLSSERKALKIDLDGKFLIVGERINPTGKKALQAELREGNYARVLDFAREQEECGAAILDINVGMSGIDEKQTMLQVIEEVTMATNLPLAIDSSHVDVIEAALRRYPGRALINSISLEREKFEKLIPIAAKYGAMFILLPLSDEGLPENLEEKKKIIDTIYEAALKAGMKNTDIVVDGLVATVGANKNAAKGTLETIRYCKEELQMATICGLSNISFGLPDRSFINTTFLTMAILNGLTMAISNPSQEMLVKCAYAADLLMNKENADMEYINTINRLKKDEVEVSVGKTEKTLKELIYEDVLKGNKATIVAKTKEAVEQGESASVLLNDILIPAINQVGDLFDKQKYFLPQLISSAETMKVAIDYLEPYLQTGEDNENLPTIVIATVEGDIHDIGKNLVALMLKNYGYRVIDLGKDVSKEEIIETAAREKADVIALSALMTTTMQEMKNVIEYAREKGVTAKIIIGGAVITQDYADEIGADGYSKDAADAVKLVKRLLGA
ncbi:MAG: homocysteine S-methyltransferase family protein [Lachnospiraceae bacterium]|nr:homocysteine S-methyltransferase family protein [Lachnospiraceae bacterium]